MKKITMAVVGLGQRGSSLLKGVLLKRSDVEVVAVCDLYSDRAENAAALIKAKTGKQASAYTDYRKMLDEIRPDSVLVSCSWESHTEVAVYALEKGVATAMEVGGCYSENEMWELVRAYEKTHTPFMFMENCCYDKRETLATNLVRAGKLGRTVHCSGAYAHDLREEIASGELNRHYRLRNYLNRNCDNYPTHNVGPIAKLLDINRGNRFIKLCSVASMSAGMERYIEKNADKYDSLRNKKFAQGDIVDTLITCAGGETVHLRLDTTLPRFYDRAFTVRGTDGLFDGRCNLVFIDGIDKDEFDTDKAYKEMAGNAEKYSAYLPEEWRNITKEQIGSGHGGMDYFEFDEFFYCLKEGREMPIDVYDAASWMIISVLSERSVAKGGAAVDFPDFTCGKWLTRERKDVGLVARFCNVE